jgi:hypothetical protein
MSIRSNEDLMREFLVGTRSSAKYGNMSFDGSWLYSWRTCVAAIHWVNGRSILAITSTHYSKSTDRQLRGLLSVANPEVRAIVVVPEVRYLTDTANFFYYIDKANALLKDLKKPRIRDKRRMQDVLSAKRALDLHRQLVMYMGGQPKAVEREQYKIEHILGNDENVVRIRSLIALTTGEPA